MCFNGLMATATHTDTGPAGERMVTMTTDLFTTLRAEWKAAGCPADHPYLTMELPSSPIVPLVGGITPEMVELASAMRPLMPERSAWR